MNERLKELAVKYLVEHNLDDDEFMELVKLVSEKKHDSELKSLERIDHS